MGANSPAFDKILAWFQGSGVDNITRWGHIIGNLFLGLGGLLSNFVGYGDNATAALDKLMKKFAKWGNSDKAQQGVRDFLQWVNDEHARVEELRHVPR